MKLLRYLLWMILPVIVASCNNNQDQSPQMEGAGIPLYIEIKIWGDEEKETVTCLLQVRSHGPNGEAILLEPPAMLELDGELLQPDSAGFSGIFYEISFPLEGFGGKHRLRFTSPEGKAYEQEFEYYAFSLSHNLMEEISSGAFELRLEDMPEDEVRVNLSLVDTSFTTNDVNEPVMVRDGSLKVTERMLSKLSKGPVMMEIFREDEQVLQFGPHRGVLTTTYGLNREFLLVP